MSTAPAANSRRSPAGRSSSTTASPVSTSFASAVIRSEAEASARAASVGASSMCGRVALVDLDAFVALRSPRWQRLEELAGRRRLTGAEIDEFTALYQATASDLSAVRSRAPSPALIGRLSALLGRARSL